MTLKVISEAIQKIINNPELNTPKKLGLIIPIISPYLKTKFIKHQKMLFKDIYIAQESNEDDLYHEAILILNGCIEKYNANKNASFLTYFLYCLKLRLPNIIKCEVSVGTVKIWEAHELDSFIIFEDINEISEKISSPEKIDEYIKDDKLMNVFNGNILDMTILSAIIELDITDNQAAQLLGVPYAKVRSAKRRLRKNKFKAR